VDPPRYAEPTEPTEPAEDASGARDRDAPAGADNERGRE